MSESHWTSLSVLGKFDFIHSSFMLVNFTVDVIRVVVMIHYSSNALAGRLSDSASV